ncbi:hypothetical protein HPB47_000699, partial [Ixodes persulcatus]
MTVSETATCAPGADSGYQDYAKWCPRSVGDKKHPFVRIPTDDGWRCKAYGHRTGDKECPMFLSGNSASEQFRFVHEDPMHEFLKESKEDEKQE